MSLKKKKTPNIFTICTCIFFTYTPFKYLPNIQPKNNLFWGFIIPTILTFFLCHAKSSFAWPPLLPLSLKNTFLPNPPLTMGRCVTFFQFVFLFNFLGKFWMFRFVLISSVPHLFFFYFLYFQILILIMKIATQKSCKGVMANCLSPMS